MASTSLKKVYDDLEFLKSRMNLIEQEIGIIADIEPKVRQSYLKKLKNIKKQEGVPFKNIQELRSIIES